MIFTDTCAILNGYLNDNQELKGEVYISEIVLRELEDIKSSKEKDERTKAAAREFVREFVQNRSQYMNDAYCVDHRQVKKILKKHSDILGENNDSKLIAQAIAVSVQLKSTTLFVTSDGCAYNIAKTLMYLYPNFIAVWFEVDTNAHSLWSGATEYELSEDLLAEFYQNPEKNTLAAEVNEYCKIIHDGEVCDVYVWDGTRYNRLKYKTFKTKLGETIAPRNLEQKLAFDLLQNDKIPVKLITGKYGSGKLNLAST